MTIDKRYSPSTFIGSEQQRIMGNPDPKNISTSIAERYNLTLRMANCRFTRLTNAFSEKTENLDCSVALTFMHYNFCRIHKSLRVIPAMEAGVADYVWDFEEVAEWIN